MWKPLGLLTLLESFVAALELGALASFIILVPKINSALLLLNFVLLSQIYLEQEIEELQDKLCIPVLF